MMGSAGPASEMFYDQIHDHFEVTKVEGAKVWLRPLRSDSDLDDLSKQIRFKGLVKASVENSQVVATLENEDRAAGFADAGGVALGPYAEPGSGGGARTVSGRGVPDAQFLEVAHELKWQSLVGEHVDVVPFLREKDAKRLKAFEDVKLLSGPSGRTLNLIFHPTQTTKRIRAVLAGNASEVAENERLPQITMRGGDSDVLDRFRRLANRVWQRTGHRPSARVLEAGSFQNKMVAGDFEALLVPIPSDRGQFYPLLLPDNYLKKFELLSPGAVAAVRAKNWARATELIGDLIIPLEEVKSYAAIGSAWCGNARLTANSWRWLSELRPCSKELN